MFETATLACGPGKKRVWATCVGITGEALLVACAMVAPMVWPQMLPKTELTTWLATPSPPPPPPPGRPAVRSRESVRRVFQYRENQLYAYTTMPAHPVSIEEAPVLGPAGPGVPGGVDGGVRNGVPNSILTDLIKDAAPPPPPQPVAVNTAPKASEQTLPRLKLGGVVLMGRLIRRVEPVYPPIAIQMRVSGEVELEAVVGADGRVRELQVKRGHPLLVRAAVEAVRQWVFQPTQLNGNPVEVSAPVTVTFRMEQ